MCYLAVPKLIWTISIERERERERERDAGQTRTVGNFIQGSIFEKQLALEGNNPTLAPLGPYSEF